MIAVAAKFVAEVSRPHLAPLQKCLLGLTPVERSQFLTPTSHDFVRTSRTFVEFCIDFSQTSMPSPRLSAPHATALMRSAADTILPSLFELSVPYQRKARRIPGALQHMLANSGTPRYKYVCICLR